MAVTKFNDPNVLAAINSAEDEFGIPSGLMQSIVVNGERSNSDQISPAGARTVFQIIPATRNALKQKYGVDAYSPDLKEQARASALVVKEGLDRNKQDPAAAVAEYHGGTNPRNHGPITNAYTKRVIGGFEGEQMAAADKPKDLFGDIITKHGGKGGESKAPLPDISPQTQTESTGDKPKDLFGDIIAKHGGTDSSQSPVPTPSQPQATPEQKQDPSFLDNVATTGKNFLPSLGNLALDTYQGIAQAIQSPVQTAKAAYVAAGKLGDYVGIPAGEDQPTNVTNSPLVQDVTAAANDPKGTIEAAGRQLRDDPARTLATVAPVLTPLKGVTATGALGATARGVGKVAGAADLVTNQAVMKPVEFVGRGLVGGAKTLAQLAVVPKQGGGYINELGNSANAAQISNALKAEARSNVPGYRRTVEDIAPEVAPFQRKTIPSKQRLELDQANDMALTSNVDQGVIPSQNLKDMRGKLTKPLYKQADDTVVDVPTNALIDNAKQFPKVYKESFDGERGINTGRQYQGQEMIPSNTSITQMKGNEINQHIRNIETEIYGEKKIGGKTAINPGTEEFKALSSHLDDVKAWRDKVLPTIEQANKIFEKYSKSINRSAVMEKFKEKLAPLLEGDSVNNRAFATSFDNPSKIIDEVLESSYNNKKISGERRLDSIITPEDKQRLVDVLDELNRRNKADSYARTRAELPEGKIPGGNVTTTANSRAAVEVGNKALAYIKNVFSSEYLKQAGFDLQDPAKFAAQLDKALPTYRAIEKTENALRGAGNVISTVGRKTPLLREIEPTKNNIVNNLRNWLTGI
jgi:hypothetical protein